MQRIRCCSRVKPDGVCCGLQGRDPWLFGIIIGNPEATWTFSNRYLGFSEKPVLAVTYRVDGEHPVDQRVLLTSVEVAWGSRMSTVASGAYDKITAI